MTAQAHERIIYEGEQMGMAFCPPLPDNHPRLNPVPFDEATKKPHPTVLFSTACWRGYIGTWEVKDDRFYLGDIEGLWEKEGDDPIFADWFTGTLRIPRGERLQYVHMGFGSVYEKELHVKIEEGYVTAFRVVDNQNKERDPGKLGWQNLPGLENRFEGDDDL